MSIDKNTGACIAYDGSLCKSGDFISRKNYKNSTWDPTKTELERIKNLKSVDYKTIDDIDNYEVYEWYQIGEDKYGRSMYCPKTEIKRTQTMGEFYGNSTVD
jgi:hypothetical protein